MVYDPEKYREKREKVLGVKKRGMGFGILSMMVSMAILAGLGGVTVPQAVSYLQTRHLDDAIFKLESGSTWTQGALAGLKALDGVKKTTADPRTTRLVVTYDRRRVKTSHMMALLGRNDLKITLLNQINHRQHQTTMNKEEEDLETP